MSVKKIKIPSEIAYVLFLTVLAFAVSLSAAADFGVSMIVGPVYILSLKLGFVTFGQAEIIVQSIMFIVFCILMRGVKLVYFSSFATCLIYSFILDGWRAAIPALNPDVTAPGSFPMWERIVFFVLSVVLTSIAVSGLFKVYLYPQVYDFFVKGITLRFGIDTAKFKRCFDAGCFLTALAMTLIFFRSIKGIGIGTVIITLLNGIIIGWCLRLWERFVEFPPIAKKFAAHFEIEQVNRKENESSSDEGSV